MSDMKVEEIVVDAEVEDIDVNNIQVDPPPLDEPGKSIPWFVWLIIVGFVSMVGVMIYLSVR